MVTVRRRRNGLYEARLQREGRRFSVYGRSEREVRRKLAELERQLALDQPPPPGRLTLRELGERWYETERQRWKPRTASDYRTLLDRVVYPELGDVRVARLTPDRLQRFFDAIPGRKASQTYRLLHRLFAVAVRWRLVAENPCDRIVPPAYRAPRVELPDAAALSRLFTHCLTSPDDYAPLVGLALLTGLRLGEITALRWDDVDLAAGHLVVRRAGQWLRGEWVETEPKTAAGRRVIPLGDLARRLLARQRAVVARRKLAAGPAWCELGLVFPATDGRPLRSDRVSAALRRLCRAAGVPRLHFHALRHAAASLAILSGAPLTEVSSFLGHSTPAITSSIYAHALRNGRVTAVLEQALVGEGG